jgi:hypothetical protein
VVVEAPIFDRDEGGAYVLGDPFERNVEPPHMGQAPQHDSRAIEDPAPFAGPERLKLGRARAAGEAAGLHPDAGRERRQQSGAGSQHSQGKRPRQAGPL